MKLFVKNDSDLMTYLTENTDYSKKKIKSLIKYKKVKINNKLIKKLPILLKTNDLVTIELDKKEQLPFEIIYEDKKIIVVNKKAGLLTVGTDKEKKLTLVHQLREYGKKHNFKVFVIHRLDKDTSGVVMFAKNEKVKKLYQDNWNDLVIKRGYIALVTGNLTKSGRIDNYLVEQKNTFVKSNHNGKRAITNYKVLKNKNGYTLLDITIETGRKNQIRVHMSELGYPIVGDLKYGGAFSPLKRMALHCHILKIKNPETLKIEVFEAPYNNMFDILL